MNTLAVVVVVVVVVLTLTLVKNLESVGHRKVLEP